MKVGEKSVKVGVLFAFFFLLGTVKYDWLMTVGKYIPTFIYPVTE